MPVALSGIWHNERGSQVSFEFGPQGRITGGFAPGVGFGTDESFPVTGFTSGKLVVFAVDFAKYGSLTAWVGHLIDDDRPRLETLWHMTLEIPHPTRTEDLWKAIWSGADTFRPGPVTREVRERSADLPPLWWR